MKAGNVEISRYMYGNFIQYLKKSLSNASLISYFRLKNKLLLIVLIQYA